MSDSLQRTPLYDLHLSLGGRMVPFAGYEMPVQYRAGVMAEHQHTRTAAGLFDVSHMGQAHLHARSGRVEDAALALERLVPADILSLKTGRQRYTQLTDGNGGILDDLMVSRLGDTLVLVVNAACKEADLAHIAAALHDECIVEALPDRALIAIQGPQAGAVMARLAPASADMRFMDVAEFAVAGVPCLASRSGYTGEDGFELGMAADGAVRVAEALLAEPEVAPAGLGARDSLRLEAGLCLYGSDIDRGTTPVEGALEWSIQKSRRTGGARAGGFPGADIILGQIEGGVSRRRVGIAVEGRAPVRGGARLFADEAGTQPVGHVTSGAFGPTFGAPVGMGYVETAFAATGTPLFAELRGRYLPAAVAALPFVAPGFKR
ncbi:glycine cleavage system aminomethyltransferase GcvT [Gluconacetobacter takamatsuzukensis]|uniref:aminomethyltransferase n=1 Tax=Gluconacetobacter takamatsuzukensis TaxID=1286190 RepID=A0A7W4PNY7_9PROT|nr:glycine cleavage system aminomethyltransferase GcvT [Gluconacetobacter takamatsuzukensis]MBB2204623.1 glycine cleavage system aminomethyltransferase GcvT [Gluconacetobacter takamatsuzukensis]